MPSTEENDPLYAKALAKYGDPAKAADAVARFRAQGAAPVAPPEAPAPKPPPSAPSVRPSSPASKPPPSVSSVRPSSPAPKPAAAPEAPAPKPEVASAAGATARWNTVPQSTNGGLGAADSPAPVAARPREVWGGAPEAKAAQKAREDQEEEESIKSERERAGGFGYPKVSLSRNTLAERVKERAEARAGDVQNDAAWAAWIKKRTAADEFLIPLPREYTERHWYGQEAGPLELALSSRYYIADKATARNAAAGDEEKAAGEAKERRALPKLLAFKQTNTPPVEATAIRHTTPLGPVLPPTPDFDTNANYQRAAGRVGLVVTPEKAMGAINSDEYKVRKALMGYGYTVRDMAGVELVDLQSTLADAKRKGPTPGR